MIVVRDIFQLHFGRAREAIELLREGRDVVRTAGGPEMRILADVTGPYYTLVLESRSEDLASWEAGMREELALEGWQAVYRRFVPLVREGRREIFREVE